jgi:hypothetical protein
MQSDIATLNEMIEHHLLNALVETDRPESVVDTVLEEYARDLVLSGKIPIAYMDEVLEELRETVLEIIRKRTYGCMTISAFKKNQFNESR